LLPTVSVPDLVLASVLASMVEPSNWQRAVRVKNVRAGMPVPGLGVRIPAAVGVAHSSVHCKIEPTQSCPLA
jgi:hypothetical protein